LISRLFTFELGQLGRIRQALEKGNPMLVATSVRRPVLAAIVIIVSVTGTAGAATASITAAGQARPAAIAAHSARVLAVGPDDTPWG